VFRLLSERNLALSESFLHIKILMPSKKHLRNYRQKRSKNKRVDCFTNSSELENKNGCQFLEFNSMNKRPTTTAIESKSMK